MKQEYAKYFAAGRECWSGENCRFEHVKRDSKLLIIYMHTSQQKKINFHRN